MDILIDTNVILDDLLNRGPNAEYARRISQMVTDGLITGYLTANCLTDIFYIVSKARDEATARKVIRNLLVSFSVVSVTGEDCQQAIDFPLNDFEDALVVVCAEKAALNYIVTNDKVFLEAGIQNVPAISPSDFVAI